MCQRPFLYDRGRKHFLDFLHNRRPLGLGRGARTAKPNISSQSRIEVSPSSSIVSRSKCHAARTSNPWRSSRVNTHRCWENTTDSDKSNLCRPRTIRAASSRLEHCACRRTRPRIGLQDEAKTRRFGSLSASGIQWSAAFENTASNSPGKEKSAPSASLNSRSG